MGKYIAIEGVKGVGKTTVIERLEEHLNQKGMHYAIICPTRKQDNSIWELLFHYFPCDFIQERMYAHRSNLAATRTQWDSNLVIGDRSILTSYATRFWNFIDPRDLINRVNSMEQKIKFPDVVLYLNASETKILERLHNRKNRLYGKKDETISKIRKDLMAYNFLKSNLLSSRTKWVDIDCNGNTDEILNQILSLEEFREGLIT